MSLNALGNVAFSNIPVAPPSPGGLQFADQGLTVEGGDTVVLGGPSPIGAPQFTSQRYIDVNGQGLRLVDSNVAGADSFFDAAAFQFNTTEGFAQLQAFTAAMTLQRTGTSGGFGPLITLDNAVLGPAQGSLVLWQVDSGGAFTEPVDGKTYIASNAPQGMRFMGYNAGVSGPVNAFEFFAGTGDPFNPGVGVMVIADPVNSDGSVAIQYGLSVNGTFPLSDVLAWGQLDQTTLNWVLDDTIALPVTIAGNTYHLAFVRQ